MVIMDISGPNPMDMCQRTGTKRMLVIWLATQWIYLLLVAHLDEHIDVFVLIEP